ncbi:MAG: THUMP domain-containing protein [Promethearchaeota archaeon]
MLTESKTHDLNGFYDTIMVRFSGEISLKSEHVRKRLLNRIISSINSLLKRNSITRCTITKTRARIFILPTPSDLPVIHHILTKIPGIVSFSYCISQELDRKNNLIMIKRLGEKILEEKSTIAVRVKREGKHAFSSKDMEILYGSFILESFKQRSISVFLNDPDVTFHVEIRHDKFYLYHESYKGMGGIPRDSTCRIMVFPNMEPNPWVTSEHLLKRGVDLDIVLIIDDPTIDCFELPRESNKILEYINLNAGIVDKLYNLLDYQHINQYRITIIPFTEEFRTFKKNTITKISQLEFSIIMQIYFAWKLISIHRKTNKRADMGFALGYTNFHHNHTLSIKELHEINQYIGNLFPDLYPPPVILLPDASEIRHEIHDNPASHPHNNSHQEAFREIVPDTINNLKNILDKMVDRCFKARFNLLSCTFPVAQY